MEDTSRFRVLMFPWLAHGHISPFFELTKKLTQRNFKVYLCSTAINLRFIKKNFAQDLSDHDIELLEFHLPESPKLPPQHHTTKNLPPHLMLTLINSFQNAKSSFSSILNSLNPDLLIYDGFQSWAPKLAATKNIPCVHFVTSGATALSSYYHQHTYGIDGDPFPFPAIFQTEYERKKMKAMAESYKGVEPVVSRCFELSSEFVLIKSSREVEEKYLDYLSSLSGKKMVTTGPLIQELNHNIDQGDHDEDIIKFLNKKDQSSVVFVSFGSEYFLSKEEREEIAYGLELSDVNFIWVIRFPVGNKISTIQEALPEEFLERVKERGMVVDGWAPQAKILEHSSTGGFVSHCGWSSAMESLHYGVPLIAMPIHFDQPTNARVMVENGVGMEVMRDEKGDFNREEVAKVIKMVVEKNGEGIRGKARELSKKLRLKGEEELDEALDEVWNLCRENKKLMDQRSS